MSGYLVNSVKVNYPGQGSYFLKAGTLVTDPILVAGVAAAGGQLASSTSATMIAAAAIVAKLRGSAASAGQGQNEDMCDKVMMAAFLADATAEEGIQHVVVDIPLATIQAQTSGVAFNIGSPLPTNARLLDYQINVLATLTGGGSTACHATLQGGSDAAGSIIASTDVFTATGSFSAIGSNAYPGRGGQQIKMTLTGDGTHPLSGYTTGHLSVDLFYQIIP